MILERDTLPVERVRPDEVFSPVQAIYDREILRYVKRLFDGHDAVWDDSLDAVEIIRDGVAQENFLTAESTVSRFRDACLFSEFFDAMDLGAWRAAGSPAKEALAWREAQRLIAEHDVEAPVGTRRRVQAVYDRAVNALQ